MGNDFEKSYMGQLRKLVGDQRIIVPGVRAVIFNKQGRVLLIHRTDSGRWGMPAGAVELGDSALDALKREVREETGLNVLSATPFAIYSHSRYSFSYPNGDKVQMFVLVFRVDQWEGELIRETDETVGAEFFPLDNLPDLHEVYVETLNDLKNYNGEFIVK
ncbi:MAG: NUDIX domain-containing protein [Candidatus Sabulitectum sp.]|nr:NUDIX domain-containing protein [Candidatus Sabulitectum sp.]